MSDGPTSDADAPCGWHGAVSDFLALDQATLLAALAARHLKVMGMHPDGGQMAAWRGEFAILTATLRDIAFSTQRAKDWVIIFEYELPRERGRRPDVVILTGSQVLVLEFKESAAVLQAHVDQVAAYARDLRHYHAASHDKLVDPVLVLTRSPEDRRVLGEVKVVNPQGLQAVISGLESRAPDEPIDAALG